jgi:hypothetical protein
MGVVVGPATLVSHLRATREVLRNELKGLTSDAQEAARIRVLLRDMDGQLREYQANIDDTSSRAGAAETAAESARLECEKQQELLVQAKLLLDKDQSQYVIGGKSYSRQQLYDDVNARLAHSKQLQAIVAAQTAIAAKLRDAERQGVANLHKAEQLKQECETEAKDLETRLANAGLLRKVNELAGKLGDVPLGPRTELGEAFAEFRNRIRAAERQAEGLAVESNDGLVVDWNAKAASEGGISGDAIGEFLTSDAKRQQAEPR